MRIVSIIHSAGHEMPMLVDRDGLPISDPNEWLFGRRSLAPTTQSRILSELVPLYSWAECRGIDIRQRIESGQGFIEAEVISGLVEALRAKVTSTCMACLMRWPLTHRSRCPWWRGSRREWQVAAESVWTVYVPRRLSLSATTTFFIQCWV